MVLGDLVYDKTLPPASQGNLSNETRLSASVDDQLYSQECRPRRGVLDSSSTNLKVDFKKSHKDDVWASVVLDRFDDMYPANAQTVVVF